MVISLPNHGRPLLETVFCHGKTMVEHGLSMVLLLGELRPISLLILVAVKANSSSLREREIAKNS